MKVRIFLIFCIVGLVSCVADHSRIDRLDYSENDLVEIGEAIDIINCIFIEIHDSLDIPFHHLGFSFNGNEIKYKTGNASYLESALSVELLAN